MYLELKNLSKHFGDVKAVNNVSLGIGKNEFVCILGPSGCGKTTLLRLIAGLEEATTGELFLNDKNLVNVPAQNRGFGIVFQSYSLFPNMTVTQNIGYGLTIRKKPKDQIEKRVLELLNLVHLEGQDEKFPHELSGGQQQRVAIARALAVEPELLLLDEPLSALDAKVRKTLRVEIREVQQSLGIPTVMVTHDQDEAMTMADRIICMRDGIVEQMGTPDELYNQPTNAFIAGFLGHMNILDSFKKLHVDVDTNESNSIGIRPEEVVITDNNLKERNTYIGKVRHIENLGSVSLMQIFAEEQTILVEQTGFIKRVIGEEIFVTFPADKIVSFSKSIIGADV
ncbi:MAG: ATP-binding cassette domain-containing protein [Cocleimonas sp.]